MKIKLEKKEFDFLASACFIPEVTRNELINGVFSRDSGKGGKEKIKLEISDESADLIRSLCMDELDQSGFDLGYTLNKKGEILNILIDKFFVDDRDC